MSYGEQMPKIDQLLEKWSPVLDAKSQTSIQDTYKRKCTAVLLENQERHNQSEKQMLFEAPSNSVGTGGFTGSAPSTPVAGYDPVLISMVRRATPKMLAYDVCGVQPLTAPSGLIFALRSHFGTDRDGNGATPNVYTNELFYGEADAGRSANGGAFVPNPSDLADNPGLLNGTPPGAYTAAPGMSTGILESLGDSPATAFREVSFSIEKVLVEAKARALQASYSLELQQDLKAVHGLDAESELANILSGEILQETNREIIRTVYVTARPGAQNNVTTPGQFDLNLDSNGRWSVERFKGLCFQIEREANAVGHLTRRGKANWMIVSADVASAIHAAKQLDYTPAMNVNDVPDDTEGTYVGLFNGKIKVYVDPYSANVSNDHYAVLGYKGASAWDAGLYYCPYVALQMVRATDPNTFQPKIGYKSRYGLVAHPYAEGRVQGKGALTANSNNYFRRISIRNLL
jgi:Major capsid protein Gp23